MSEDQKEQVYADFDYPDDLASRIADHSPINLEAIAGAGLWRRLYLCKLLTLPRFFCCRSSLLFHSHVHVCMYICACVHVYLCICHLSLSVSLCLSLSLSVSLCLPPSPSLQPKPERLGGDTTKDMRDARFWDDGTKKPRLLIMTVQCPHARVALHMATALTVCFAASNSNNKNKNKRCLSVESVRLPHTASLLLS